MKSTFLLPRGLRPLGFIFAAVGILLLIARFYFGIKPEFLEVKVFAFYSVYLDVKSMTVIQNQVAEEIGGVLALTGLFMIAFAREKKESEHVNAIRLASFFIAAYGTVIFLVFGILFTYGLGFVYLTMISVVLWLLIYIAAFRFRLFWHSKHQIVSLN